MRKRGTAIALAGFLAMTTTAALPIPEEPSAFRRQAELKLERWQMVLQQSGDRLTAPERRYVQSRLEASRRDLAELAEASPQEAIDTEARVEARFRELKRATERFAAE